MFAAQLNGKIINLKSPFPLPRHIATLSRDVAVGTALEMAEHHFQQQAASLVTEMADCANPAHMCAVGVDEALRQANIFGTLGHIEEGLDPVVVGTLLRQRQSATQSTPAGTTSSHRPGPTLQPRG